MRAHLLPTTSALVFASAACAQGSTAPLGVVGQGGDVTTGSVSSATASGTGAASVASSGATSSGGGAASSGPASTSSSVVSSSSSSSGSTCSDTPCKLTAPQCGCPSGEACSVFDGVVSCQTAGTTGPTELCSGSFQCEAGLLCVASGSSSTSPGICDKFCDTDADCTAPGGLCIVQVDNGSGVAVPNVTLCTDNCDLVTNAGCPAPGTSCQLGQEQTGQMRYFTACAAAGTGSQGMECDSTNPCAPTFGCFSAGAQDTCSQFCDVANPSCATCAVLRNMAFQPVYIGNKKVGICN